MDTLIERKKRFTPKQIYGGTWEYYSYWYSFSILFFVIQVLP